MGSVKQRSWPSRIGFYMAFGTVFFITLFTIGMVNGSDTLPRGALILGVTWVLVGLAVDLVFLRQVHRKSP